MPAASTAASASSTAPGPRGIPASRRARAKWMMFCAKTPPLAGSASKIALISRGSTSLRSNLQPAKLGARLLDQRLRLCAFYLCDIVLIFQQHAERIGDLRRVERYRVELGQRGRPVERLGDARRLEQVLLAQTLNERDKFRSQSLRRARRLRAYDRHLAREVGIAEPMIERTTLERGVSFARAVGGDDDDPRVGRRHD